MSDKQINIGVGADLSNLKDSMKEAANVLQTTSKAIQENSTATTKVVSQNQQTLQQAYRATFRDAQRLAETQGTNSKAFLEATQKAGEYKNKLDDVAQITKAMSSDTPVLSAALGVGQGLAGAFAAAQGAMALFGSDSKLIQETMLKVQGSIALVSGLTALGGLADALAACGAVITTSVLPAFAALQAAIMANPIFSAAVIITGVVVALVAFANAMDDAGKATKEAAADMEAFNKAIQDYIQTDEQRQLAAAEKENKVIKDKVQLQIKLYEQRNEMLKSVGQSLSSDELKEYYKLKSDLLAIENKYQSNIAEIKNKNKEKTKKESPLGEGIKYANPLQVEGKNNIISDLMKLPNIIKQVQIPLIEFKGHVNELAVFFDELGQQIGSWGNLVGNTLGNVGYAFGSALAGATDMGKEFMSIIGGIAGELGSALIKMGLAIALIAPLKGGLMIAAGLGLKVLAGALGGSSQGGSTSSGYGTSNQAQYSGSFMPQFQNTSTLINVGGAVRGQDIVISTINTAHSNKRVRR